MLAAHKQLAQRLDELEARIEKRLTTQDQGLSPISSVKRHEVTVLRQVSHVERHQIARHALRTYMA